MKNILLTILALLFFGCGTVKITAVSDYKIDAPPGTIKISENFYFDHIEITNFYYAEFLSWTKGIYGSSSNEYRSILPEKNVWSKLGAGYASLDTFYLNHSAYRDFPVTGISYEQAIKYSNWRSDRVMEYILVREEFIPYKASVPKDSIFTIEKYFNGQYYGIQPNQDFLIYPHYALPDSSSYEKISLFADSLNAKNYKSCRKKFCGYKMLTECHCFRNRPLLPPDRPYGPDPTIETSCGFCKNELITHLKGNVREMTNIKGQFYGSSFIDPCEIPNNICRRDTSLVNCYTGFRNVCEYRYWKK